MSEKGMGGAKGLQGTGRAKGVQGTSEAKGGRGTGGGGGVHGMRELLQDRERRIERTACLIRIGVAILGCAADAIAASSEGVYGGAVTMVALGVAYSALVAWVFVLLGRGHYRWWVKYALTTLDYVLLGGATLYWAEAAVGIDVPLGQLGSSMIAFVPVLNLLSGLRVGKPIIVFSTLCAVAVTLGIGIRVDMRTMVVGYDVGVMVISGVLAFIISTTTSTLFVRYARRSELTRFLPKEIVDQVDRGELRLELGGSDQEVTILMSDIRGFTSMSETRTPLEVVSQLNEYFTAMSEVIFAHGGSIDKFIGDAILAVFGVPEPGPGDARRALAAAEGMLEALERLNQRWAEEEKPLLRIGVGLHTGTAVAGNIGSPQRMEYTVIGDTVNVASRIEGLTKTYGTALLLSETTREAIGGDLQARLVDEAEIRGRRGTVRLYTTTGASAGSAAAAEEAS